MIKSLLSSIQQGILTTLLKLKTWRARFDLLSIRDSWQNVRSCLICWSQSGLTYDEALPVLERLQKRFPQAKVTVLTLPGSLTPILPDRFNMLEIKEQDVNLFGLPSRQVKERIQRLDADIAVDLAQTFVPMSAYCCFLSGSRIKMGFANPESDLVFNYQIAPGSRRSNPGRYHVLAHYIG